MILSTCFCCYGVLTIPRFPALKPATLPYYSLVLLADTQEIGNQAVWSLSSAKADHGVECLRDDNLDTYWQSDGTQPHIVTIQFPKKVSIVALGIYSVLKLDESYTPHRIAIRCGATACDAYDVVQKELEAPNGWEYISLLQPNNKPLRTNFIQIVILSNHQNGRDSHLRQVKVYGPRQDLTSVMKIPRFESLNFKAYSIIK